MSAWAKCFWLLWLAIGFVVLARGQSIDPPKVKLRAKTLTQGAGAAALIAKSAIVVPSGKTNFIAWKYPPNATNYWWNLEHCTNLARPVWTVVVSNVTEATAIVTNTRAPGICLYRLCGRTNP